MKTPRQFGVIILQLTLIQQTVQTVHNLYKHQIIEVDLSDTIQAATGDFIPVSKLINMKVEEEYKQGQITILKHLTKYILTKETDQVVHVFSLVLKEEDKSSPVSGNLEASLEAAKYQTNTNTTTVYKTEEAIMKKHIASLYSRVSNLEKASNTSKSDEALASKTPNYSIFGPKILYSDTEIQSTGPKTASDFESAKDSSDTTNVKPLKPQTIQVNISDIFEVHRNFIIPVQELFSTLKSDKDTWKQGNWEVWVVKNNGKKLGLIIYANRISVLSVDLVLNQDQTASDSETEPLGSKTVQVDYTKAEQEVRISVLESDIKYLNNKIDKILKLYFKDKDNK